MVEFYSSETIKSSRYLPTMLRLYRLRLQHRKPKRVPQVPESPQFIPPMQQADPITEAMGSAVLGAIQEGRIQVTLFPKRDKKSDVQQQQQTQEVEQEYLEPEEPQNARPRPDDWLRS